VKWRKPPTHKLVPAADVYELIGFSAKQVLLQRDTQRLVRIDPDGGRRDFVRIPVALVSGEAGDSDTPGG
jgi:hypothetical protein